MAIRPYYFDSGLTKDEHNLVIIRDELYNGSWERMIEDLTARLKGKSYIFKLANNIKYDLALIEKIKQYEKRYEISNALQLVHY